MLPTPDTSHVSYDRIYEPAEDSYLLLDTLSSPREIAFLSERFNCYPSPIICEIGTGSGVVLAFLAAQSRTIFGRADVATLGTDINSYACHATSKTVKRAISENRASEIAADLAKSGPGAFMGALNADLTGPLRSGTVDVLIFNPPYVPAPLPDLARHTAYNAQMSIVSSQQAFDRDSHLLSLSYAGGEDGMEITNKLLEEIPHVLSLHSGVAYVLLCAQNKPDQVMSRIKNWPGRWCSSVVGRSGKQAGWEKLVILRIYRDAPVED